MVHSDVFSTVATALQKAGIKEEDSILCGVSGGVDSVVLAFILQSLRKQQFFTRLAIAHVDHMIRGKESSRDAAFVKRLAEKLDVPFFLRLEDVAALAARNRMNLEEAAREVRYSFFRACAEENDFRFIATGHNADDQVETILMNIVRGSGIRGLQGIPATRMLGDGVQVVRPLLELSRAEITDVAKANRLTWKEDSSNSSEVFTRNRLRSKVVPALRDSVPNRSIYEGFARISAAASEQQQFIASQVQALRNEACSAEAFSLFVRPQLVVFRREVLFAAPTVVLKEFLLLEAQQLCGHYISFSWQQYEAMAALIAGKGPNALQLSGELLLQRVDASIELRLLREPEQLGAPLDLTHSVATTAGTIVLKRAPKKTIEYSDNIALIRSSVVKEKGLLVRNWMPSDTIRPFGMKGRRKVSDLLAEAGIRTRSLKEHVPVVVFASDPKTIVWIPGIRASEECRIKSGETAYLLSRIVK